MKKTLLRTVYYMGMLLNMTCFIIWQIQYHDSSFTNYKWEMGNFYYPGNWTFYALGERTLYSLGNGKFYSLGTILSSGNRTTYPLVNGPIILWDSGHPLENGTWETGHAILWESDHLSSGNHPLGSGIWEMDFDCFQLQYNSALHQRPC